MLLSRAWFGKPSGMPCRRNEEPWGLFLPHLLHLAQTGMVRLEHRCSPAGDTNWDGNTVERTSRWQQSLLDCHFSRPRKNTQNYCNTALWEQRAPCTVHSITLLLSLSPGKVRSTGLWTGSSISFQYAHCAWQSSAPGRGHRELAAPISTGKGQSSSSSMGSSRRHIAV